MDIDVQHLSYYFPFGKHAYMYDDTDNLLVVDLSADKPMHTVGTNSSLSRVPHFSVPLLAHEVCHYTALRDFAGLKNKFLRYKAPLPWWINEELKLIEEKGYGDCYNEMYLASKHFQAECWKTAFEAMRASELLGGFHFLQFADTDVYENSNGVVDCFDDETYVTPEFFGRFNGERVLLCDLKSRLFYGAEEIILPVKFSGFGKDGVKSATFSFGLFREDGEKCAFAEMPNIDVSKKGVYEICKIRVRLPKIRGSEKLTLRAELLADGGVYAENEWSIWAFEKSENLTYREFVY